MTEGQNEISIDELFPVDPRMSACELEGIMARDPYLSGWEGADVSDEQDAETAERIEAAMRAIMYQQIHGNVALIDPATGQHIPAEDLYLAMELMPGPASGGQSPQRSE